MLKRLQRLLGTFALAGLVASAACQQRQEVEEEDTMMEDTSTMGGMEADTAMGGMEHDTMMGADTGMGADTDTAAGM